MNSRGITGKWKAIWHSSPSAPKYSTTSAGPLVGLAEQDPVGVLRVDLLADPLEELVGAREVLAVGALLLEQVGHRVEPEAVDAEVEPELQRLDDGVLDPRVLEVEVGLVAEEAVPEVLLAHRVERPVGRLGVDEDDARVGVGLVGVGPDVEVAVRAVRVGARRLEPRVLVGRVVHDEVDDHPDAALVRRVDELHEVAERAELRQHVGEVADVVAAVAQRRPEERRQPDAVDPEPVEVVELVGEAGEVAGAVAVAVLERPDQHLVEDRALVPVRVALAPRAGRRSCRSPRSRPRAS